MIYLKPILNEILQEAPIGSYSYSSETDADSFSTTDKHLVSADHNIKKIKNFFSKTPYIFNLYFINKKTSDPEVKKFLDSFNYGLADQDLLQKLNINIIPSKTEINTIFVSNYGTNLVPLTPWIIAHRMSHAILGYGGNSNTSERKYHNEKINEYFFRHIKNIENDISSCISFWYKTKPDGYQWLLHNNDVIEKLYKEFFTFKSARTENLTSPSEVYHELFAQYIKNGTISFNFAKQFTYNNVNFSVSEKLENQLKKEEIKIVKSFNDTYSQILKFSLGKTFII